MATKRALLVGLQFVDWSRYPGGWNGRSGCEGCGKDVQMMSEILRQAGFDNANISVLQDEAATMGNVLAELNAKVNDCRSGDLLVFYFTGHGSFQADKRNPKTSGDESDGQDELLCLYDGYLLDDRLFDAWKNVRRGARVLTISDSCHSGTNMRKINTGSFVALPSSLGARPTANAGSTSGDSEVEVNVEVDGVRGSFVHIAGCPDDATSKGGNDGSKMTLALFNEWNRSNHGSGMNYQSFHQNIAAAVQSFQRSLILGWGVNSRQFLAERPFA